MSPNPLRDRLSARRHEQTPQALARLVVIALFIGMWLMLWFVRMPMPLPFLVTLLCEAAFFLVYWRTVFLLPSLRHIELAHYTMLAAEIAFHTTMVYFLGGVSWLGSFAYVFGLIFTNAFLDLRRGLVYTGGAAFAFISLVVLEATGVVPYYQYLQGGPLSYKDTQFVVTTGLGGPGVFFSIYLWVNWVGHQLRIERDAAVSAQDSLLTARARLQEVNADLEARVAARTAELRESEQVLRETIESTTDGVLAFSDGKLVHINRLFGEIWHITRDVIESRDPALLRDGIARQIDDPDGFLARIRDLFTSPHEDFETLQFRDGRVIESYSRPLLRNGGVIGRVWSFRDVTERIHAERMLLDRADRDGLTGTLNHAAIIDALRALISENSEWRRCAVAMLDVDGMKATNDTFGHPVGDGVLLRVADALERDGAFVGRYGGDEFLVLLPGADRAAAEQYRATVLAQLSHARVANSQEPSGIPIVASMGLAVYPDDAVTVADLVALSDAAMYASRRERRAGEGADTSLERLSSERAAQLVGELVPMLTSPGDLNDKLRLVSQRLSVGAGYAAVNIEVFAPHSRLLAQNVYRAGSEGPVGLWNDHARAGGGGAIREIIARTRAPLMLDDLGSDQRIDSDGHKLLRAAGMRSAIVVPMLWQGEAVGMLAVGCTREAAFTARDAHFLTAVANQVTAIVRIATQATQLEKAQAETVVMLAAAAEAHDHTTGRHLQRVRAISEALARELGYSEPAAAELALAAVLHDIGKIRVPDALLSSAGSLDAAQWTVMQRHTIWGAAFLGARPGFELAAEVAAAHHERWDGQGYPHGLAGEAIPEAATIVAVADSFDAMTNDRPYRTGRPAPLAVREIQSCAGTQFSPKVVAALTRLHERRAIPMDEEAAEEESAA